MHDNRIRGILPIAIASVLWGTTGTAAHALPADVSPLATGAVTMGVGGLLLFLFSARAAIDVFRDRGSLGWLLTGAVGVVAYPLAFYSSMDAAGVAIGTVVSLGTAPVFAAILEFVVDRRPVSARWGVSTAIAVAGVVLLATSGDTAAGGGGTLVGVLLGILAAASYALYTFASGRVIANGHSSRSVMGALFGAGAVLLLPVLVATGAPLMQSPTSIAIAAYLSLGPMFAAYLLFGAGLRWVPSSTATVVTLIEPAVATVLAVVVVGERFGAVGWIGLALVVVGIVLLVLPGPARDDVPEPGPHL